MTNSEHERLLWVDELCDRFEAAWGTEKQFSIELVLQNISPDKTEPALKALLVLERDFRASTEKPLTETEMRRRFPNYESVVDSVTRNPSLKDSLTPDADTIAPQSSTPPVGLRIPQQMGRYRIIRKLGQGGMGAVFLAHDEQLDRDVALKIPRGNVQYDAELRGRFEREARAVAALNHPNICRIYDIGDFEGIHYICMGYIEGFPLSRFAVADSGLSELRIAELILRLAKALSVAHEAGFIHRDLKPANVMMDVNDEPVILDFGLARRIDPNEDTRVTQTGANVGSPAYMSPEQVDGHQDKVGIQTDVYSLGVILYELLTGRLPFEGSMASVLGQIMTKQPDRPSDYRRHLSVRLENICLRMMEKDPAKRHPSMHAVVAALQEYLDKLASETVSAMPESGMTIEDPGTMRRQQIEGLIRSADYAKAEKLMVALSRETADSLREAAAWAATELPGLRKTREQVRAGRQDIYDTASRLMKSYDYEQAAQLLEEYPFDLRTPKMQELLEHAEAQANEVERLRNRIGELRNRGDNAQLLATLKALLELKPNDRKAKELQEQLTRRSTGPISRLLGNRKPSFMDNASAVAEWLALLLVALFTTAYPAYQWSANYLAQTTEDPVPPGPMPKPPGDDLYSSEILRPKLQRIGLALRTFHDKHNRFPFQACDGVGGAGQLSWRVAILPYLGEDDLYAKFRRNESWDSPHNVSLLKEMPDVFRTFDHQSETTLVGVSGRGSMFDGKRSVGIKDITDGTQNTVHVVAAQADRSVPWTQPTDIQWTAPATTPFACEFEGHTLVGTAHGDIVLLNSLSTDSDPFLIADGGIVPPTVFARPDLPSLTHRPLTITTHGLSDPPFLRCLNDVAAGYRFDDQGRPTAVPRPDMKPDDWLAEGLLAHIRVPSGSAGLYFPALEATQFAMDLDLEINDEGDGIFISLRAKKALNPDLWGRIKIEADKDSDNVNYSLRQFNGSRYTRPPHRQRPIGDVLKLTLLVGNDKQMLYAKGDETAFEAAIPTTRVRPRFQAYSGADIKFHRWVIRALTADERVRLGIPASESPITDNSDPHPRVVLPRNLVQNGGFESDKVTGRFREFSSADSVSNWVVKNGTVELCTTGPYAGENCLDLDGTSAGTLQQTLSTEPGKAYVLRFQGRQNGFQRVNNSMIVSCGASLKRRIQPPTIEEWSSYELMFTSSGTRCALTFQSNSESDSNSGVMIDEVSVVERTSETPSEISVQRDDQSESAQSILDRVIDTYASFDRYAHGCEVVTPDGAVNRITAMWTDRDGRLFVEDRFSPRSNSYPPLSLGASDGRNHRYFSYSKDGKFEQKSVEAPQTLTGSPETAAVYTLLHRNGQNREVLSQFAENPTRPEDTVINGEKHFRIDAVQGKAKISMYIHCRTLLMTRMDQFGRGGQLIATYNIQPHVDSKVPDLSESELKTLMRGKLILCPKLGVFLK